MNRNGRALEIAPSGRETRKPFDPLLLGDCPARRRTMASAISGRTPEAIAVPTMARWGIDPFYCYCEPCLYNGRPVYIYICVYARYINMYIWDTDSTRTCIFFATSPQ